MGEVIIKADQIYKAYSNGKRKLEVLSGIDLTVNSGDIITIMGHSGAGKSTLLNILGTLDKPDSGILEINNIKIDSLLEDELAELRGQRFGFIFQSFHLIPTLTALENVVLSAELNSTNGSQKKSINLLNVVGLTERLHHYPAQLSGGEQQRLCLARAFVNEPDIVLADEPTGNLDSKNSKHLLDLMIGLHLDKKATIALVTHESNIAGKAERILVMADGKIIEDSMPISP